MNAYVTKNLWGYEIVNPIPVNISNNFVKFYITDDLSLKPYLLNNGWDVVVVVDSYRGVSDFKDRRRIISEINCFPQKYINELVTFDKVFITDSNIISLWNDFSDFTDKCHTDKCLYVTSGWYSSDRDNIIAELNDSNQSRWSYDFDSMKTATERYKNEVELLGIDFYSVPIISAKYFGWNLNHKNYENISNKFYNEYTTHLQGNIILSYLSILYSSDTFNYKISNFEGCKLSVHNFLA